MIKTSEFIEQYRKGKVPASTLIKMAAFKSELEALLAAQSQDSIVKIATELPGGLFKQIFSKGRTALDTAAHFGIGGINIGGALIGGGVFGASMQLFMEAVKALEGKVIDWMNDTKKPKLFADMMMLHPQLGEYDKKLVETYYEALWHFSPVMAENPLAAGAYIRQALSMHHVAGGPLPNSINEVAMIQKNWHQGTDDKSESPMTTIMSPMKGGIMSWGGGKGKD
jgi:hypothetical protein